MDIAVTTSPLGPARVSGNVTARSFDIEGPLLVGTRRYGDVRGWFTETWSGRDFAGVGIGVEFVQDNLSLSGPVGTLRGMHFQTPPCAQGKLVRVVRGSVLDVVVDLRRSSPTYGRWAAARLTGAGGEQMWVPEGFAHGFVTLEPDTEFAYKVTAYYAPECDRGLAWDDPDLRLPWPDFAAMGVPGGPVLSDKDRRQPRLRDLPPLFL